MAEKFASIVLLFSAAAVMSTGNPEVKGSPQPVKVSVGDDVILPCHLEPPIDATALVVEWRLNATRVHVYRNRRDAPDLQHKDFRHRTSLFHAEISRGNLSLKLSSVSKTIAGNYTCYVPHLASQVRKGYILLIVEDQHSTAQQNDQPTSAALTVEKDRHTKDSNHLGLGLGIGLSIGVGIIIIIVSTILAKKYGNQTLKTRRSSKELYHMIPGEREPPPAQHQQDQGADEGPPMEEEDPKL
ncbi:myelin-oligodendrocyte glycoprotein-like [Lates japonicus]